MGNSRLLSKKEIAKAMFPCLKRELTDFVTGFHENIAEAQDSKTLKVVGEWMRKPCPHDNRFPRADCSLCAWELCEATERGELPE